MFYIAAEVQNVYPRPAFAQSTMNDVLSFIFANKDKLVSFEASLVNKFEYQYSFDFSTATFEEFEKANYIPASFMWGGKESTENDNRLMIEGNFLSDGSFNGSIGNKQQYLACNEYKRFTNSIDLLFWLAGNAKGTLNITFTVNTDEVLLVSRFDKSVIFKREEKRFSIIL